MQGVCWGMEGTQPHPTTVPSTRVVLSIPKEGPGSLHIQQLWWQGGHAVQISAANLSLAQTISVSSLMGDP